MIELIIDNPLQTLTIVSFTVCSGLFVGFSWFAWHLYQMHRDEVARQAGALEKSDARAESNMARMENTLAQFEMSFAKAMSETRTALLTHSSDLGKATKAISGEMLKVRDQVMSLKEDLGQRIDKLREYTLEFEQSIEAMSASVAKVMHNFDEKFGGVKQLSEKLEETFGRIIHLEETSEKYAQMFRSAAQAINVHKERLGKLEGKK